MDRKGLVYEEAVGGVVRGVQQYRDGGRFATSQFSRCSSYSSEVPPRSSRLVKAPMRPSFSTTQYAAAASVSSASSTASAISFQASLSASSSPSPTPHGASS